MTLRFNERHFIHLDINKFTMQQPLVSANRLTFIGGHCPLYRANSFLTTWVHIEFRTLRAFDSEVLKGDPARVW